MLKNKRLLYFVLFICTVLLGVISRSSNLIPLFFGDVLYAVMVYFGMCFLFIKYNAIQIISVALVFCYGIEFLQLYEAEWIVAVRRTTLGHYALGQGFLWSDLVYYLFGVSIAFAIDTFLIRKTKQKAI